MITNQLLAEIDSLKDEIKNLNGIITAAINSSNASHFRAMEYQSQRDTLASLLQDCRPFCEPMRQKMIAEALDAVKGGSYE